MKINILESEKIEFKSQYTDDLNKSVLAFANTSGGTVYVGIDNQQNIVGIQNIDDIYTKITNSIRDTILPDITLFVKYTLDSRGFIKIEVEQGAFKPYYLSSKGIKPSGVYIRQGASSVPASFDKIRQMIKEADNSDYEKLRSIDQDLTFTYTENYFQQNQIEFSKQKFLSLGLINADTKQYTNMALLLSDQCPFGIKIAVFNDDENTSFYDNKYFTGSILQQMNQAFDYLQLCNKKSSEIQGLVRIEKKDYPDFCLRECLLNAIIHRDYTFSGDIIINVNDSKIEFISLGGLVQPLNIEDIFNGISQPRNKNLANVFLRLHLIESYGTGLRRIFKMYKDEKQPELKVTQNSFKITLYKQIPEQEKTFFVQETKQSFLPNYSRQTINLINELRQKQKMTFEEICLFLNIKSTRGFVLLQKLKQENLITQIGRGKGKYYTLT